MNSTDVLVIGAGPAGTIAAAIIKKAGYNVVVVEKMQFPRFVIGESLLPRCMEALEEAGFLEAVKAKQFQQKNGAKFVIGDKICDFNFTEQHSKGWQWTWQVPREEFDNTLAQECINQGIDLRFETEVTNIELLEDETSITTIKDKHGDESTIRARFIIDGSGYGRVIPRLFNLERPSNLPARQTLFTHFEDTKRALAGSEPNRITIHIYNKDTWIWVIPFSNGNTSVGFVGYPSFFEGLEGDSTQRLSSLIQTYPPLAERFKESAMRFEPREIKAWSVTTDKFYGPGYVLTGNVTEFLDPVFSSGVTLASVSAQNAAKLVIKKLKGEHVDWQKEYMEICMKGVEVFRTFVMAWYDGDLHDIFFSKNQNPEMRAQICSVLAGYVWDESNPFVVNHSKNVKSLAKFIRDTQGEG